MQELQQIINNTWENWDLLKNKENQDASGPNARV